MAIDYIVQRTCDPRVTLGSGNLQAGSAKIMALKKSANLAAILAEHAKRSGVGVETLTVKRAVLRPNANEPQAVTVGHADLVAEAAPLAQLGAQCDGCPARATGEPFSCYQSISYPIPEVAESWLLSRVRGPDALAGNLLFGTLKDLGADGARAAGQMRQRGIMVARVSPERSFKTGFLGTARVTADQLWQLILMTGNFSPNKLATVLASFEMLRIDGRAPQAPPELRRLLDHPESVTFDPGPTPQNPALVPFHAFFRAMFVAWKTGSTFLLDA